MSKKKVPFSNAGIDDLPNDKPAVYKILTRSGKPNYIGTAKRGRVRERLREHLGKIPGERVQIEQVHRIRDAQKRESRAIKRSNPKYNTQRKQR